MNITANPNDLLNEFDLIGQLIAKAHTRTWSSPARIQTLEGIFDDMFIALDEETRPRRKTLREIIAERMSARIAHPLAIPKKTSPIGFEYKSDFKPCTSCLDIYRNVLLQLWKDFPEKREAIAASVKRVGYNRSYISNEREKLFHKKEPRWIRKYSRLMLDGWYIDVNVTPERIRKILPVAVCAAGLKWESDVCVIWE